MTVKKNSTSCEDMLLGSGSRVRSKIMTVNVNRARGVRKFKKKGDRTYYYSALANPQEMLVAGLGKWIDDQKIMRRELSTLKAKLKSFSPSKEEKKDAEKLLAILEDFEKAFDEAEKVFVELKERLMKT